MSEKLFALDKRGGVNPTIPMVRGVAASSSAKIYFQLALDIQKYKGIKYTLEITNAAFSGSEYIRLYAGDGNTLLQDLSKTAGTYTLNFDPTWTGFPKIVVYAHGTSQYGYVQLKDIEFLT